MTVFTVRLDEPVAEALRGAAVSRSASAEELIACAVEWFVAQETGRFTAAEEEEIARETEALGQEDAVAAVRARRLGMPEYQIEAIKAGIADVRAGRTIPQEELFAKLDAKYGW